MFYAAHLDDSNDMAHNSEKDVQASSFGDYYDMDSEVNYQDLFIAQPDQAVPDFLTLNTPPVSQSSAHPLSNLPYMHTTDSAALTAVSNGYSYPIDNSSLYSSHTPSPVPLPILHELPSTNQQLYANSRGPVIVPSATAPEPKPRRKGGRKPKNDPLPPHLEERRRLRRIRNKEAAQKCRERRLAQTDELLQEIEQLEKQTRQYEEFINRMREYKEECEYVLNSHKSHCNQAAKRRVFNPYNNTPCAAAHRRSSSSEGDILSPSYVL
ncbi:transcription factor kayak-like isoform X2 [Watersipora subatra]|uniref:transcription factor kayak-like isoform X2 n=1 Tax=Watersipora subatra TaxID=2589382 RepID=UPI00355BC33F